MKKILTISCGIFAVLAISVSCNKVSTDTPSGSNTPDTPSSEKITITATLSDALTKVSFDPVFSGTNPTSMAHKWQTGDKLRITNESSTSVLFDLISGENTDTGIFQGDPIDGTSFTVEAVPVNSGSTGTHQTQDSDGSTDHLMFVASATGVTDLSNIELTEVSNIIGIVANLPTGVAATINMVEIEKRTGNPVVSDKLNILITNPGDPENDGILKVYANVPASWSIAENTKMFLRFKSTNTAHTVYTRYQEFTSAVTPLAGKFNYIKINCSQTDKHAGAASSDGTFGKAYLIADGYQMQALNGLLASKKSGTTVYAELVDDIDLSVYSNWTSIDAMSRFINLQGNGHKISNLKVTSATGSGNYRYHGLFGVLYGTVENVTLADADVAGGNRSAGILAGYLGASDGASNCSVHNVTIKDSKIEGNSQYCGAVAGLIGQNATASFAITISNVSIDNTAVSSNVDCGGLLGQTQGAGSVNRTLTISQVDIINSSVETKEAGSYVGGLIGQLISPNTTISDINIKGTTVKGLSSAKAVGGIFGLVSSAADIDRCTYEKTETKEATVTGPTKHNGAESTAGAYIGGIAGEVSGAASFDDCHVKNATVTFTNPSENINYWKYTGGAFGYIHNASATVGSTKNCTIESSTVTAHHYSGGFVGYLDGGSITNTSITGLSYSGWNYSGGFVGVINSGEISNCSVDGSTIQSGNSTFGGFVGHILSGTLEHNNCSIQVGDKSHKMGTNVGGFVGIIHDATKISDCHAHGSVFTSGGVCGGFAGITDAGTTVPIDNCSASGDVSIDGNSAGGFIGYAKGGSFTSCYSSGSVSSAYYGGGFVGRSNAASFNACHYDGTAVSCSGTAANAMAGGFVGQSDGVDGDIFDGCYVYNASGVTVTGKYQRSGGFVGQIGATTNHSGTYSKCYVKNVTVNGTGNNNGCFVGVQYATIEKCWVEGGSINASGNNTGGFSGFIQAADLNDCFSTATVVGSTRSAVGGLVGVTNSGININRCYFAGTVTGTGSNVGYLIGSLVSGATANKCISWSSTQPLTGNAAGTQTDCYIKDSSETGTVSSHAQESPRSWSSSVWVFTGDLPTLK